MKLMVITLVAAVVAASFLGIAGQAYGYHSTPGMWLAVPNLPGIVTAAGLAQLIGGDSGWLNGLFGLFLVALGNWLAYFGRAKIALVVMHRISNGSR